MKRIIHISIWILAGIFVKTSMLAQNPFTYYKGK